MKVEEFMVKNVITLEKDVSVLTATKMMNANMIGCLVALFCGRIVGILTERDLLKRVIEPCRNPKETKVSEIMTKNVIVGDPEMQLADATRLMFENRVKKLPVVEDDQLVGLITVTDIARAIQTDRRTIELVEALRNMHAVGESMQARASWPKDVLPEH
jgi:CBS domain-containing protein